MQIDDDSGLGARRFTDNVFVGKAAIDRDSPRVALRIMQRSQGGANRILGDQNDPGLKQFVTLPSYFPTVRGRSELISD
jgi:hypothetical protein